MNERQSKLRLKKSFDELFTDFDKLKSEYMNSESVDYKNNSPFSDLREKISQLYISYSEMERTFIRLLQDFQNNYEEPKLDRNWEWLNLKSKVEYLYYLSHRIKKILNNEVGGFNNFDPKGIRNVRNHYLEHPKARFSSAKNILDTGPTFGFWKHKVLTNGSVVRVDSEYTANIYKDLKEFLDLFILQINQNLKR